MDDAPDEKRLYQQLIEPLKAIRRRMSLAAPATAWHCATAERMMREPDWAAQVVDPSIDAAALPAHLHRLPDIFRSIEHQDRVCAAAWRGGHWDTEPADFTRERDTLFARFELLHLRLHQYERVVRQPDKPLLRQARALVEPTSDDEAADKSALEDKLRMKLPQYLENENTIIALLQTLDQARADVVQMHVYWALDLAQTLHPLDAATESAAVRAVENAVKYYDHRTQYRFRTYAEEWVREYVRRASGGQ